MVIAATKLMYKPGEKVEVREFRGQVKIGTANGIVVREATEQEYTQQLVEMGVPDFDIGISTIFLKMEGRHRFYAIDVD